MKVWEDLTQNSGYYYVRTAYNINYFLITLAFAFLSFGFSVVWIIFGIRDGESFFSDVNFIIMSVVTAVILIPFVIYFFARIVSYFLMKLKIDQITKNGKIYSAEIVDEKQCELVYDPARSAFDFVDIGDVFPAAEKRHTYKPIVKVDKGDSFSQLESKYAFNNSYQKALYSPKVKICVYKNDFIITDLKEAAVYGTSVKLRKEKIDTLAHFQNKDNARVIILLSAVPLIMAALVRIIFYIILKF